MSQVELQLLEQQCEETTCPDCGGEVTRSRSERYCEACGLIVEERSIDHGPEWRGIDSDERERTGPARTVTRHDRGLSTEIGRYRDAKGNQLSSEKRRRLGRQRHLHSRAQMDSKRERNQVTGFTEIKRITAALDLGKALTKQACSLFETVQSEDLLIGRSIEAGAAAAVVIVCRMNEPRRAREIAAYSDRSTETVRHMSRVLQRELELPVPIQTAPDYVPEIIHELETGDRVDPQVQTEATTLAQAATDVEEIRGKPSAIAAACIYEVGQRQDSQLGWSQDDVADAADVSTGALRSHWKSLHDLSILH